MKRKFERASSFSRCEVSTLWLSTVQSAEDTVDRCGYGDLWPVHFVASWFWYPELLN